jgi:hypothetical protein
VIELEATQELLKNKKDKVVFVCPGDTLTWKIGGGTSTTIDVSVKPPFEEDLFGAGNSHVTSTTGAATSKEVTGDSSKHAYFFKYDLVVKVGSSTFTLDPHVIPTGN